MTVHGAKGLEAPIVILADTVTPPQGWHPPKLLPLPPGKAAPATPHRLVWASAKANDVGPMAAAREAALDEARDEYRRLLYVAMTRAIERLIVCGVEGKTQAAGGMLVRAGARRAQGALRDRTSRPRRGHGAALSQDAGHRRRRGKIRRRAGVGCDTIPDWLGKMVEATRPRRADQAVGLRRRSGRDRTARRGRGAAARAPARQHRAPADAIAAGHSGGAPGRGRAPIHRAAADRLDRTRARRDREPASWRCSPTRALRSCSRRAAGPRFPSSAASATTP